MSYLIVKNLNGTTGRECVCGSWRNHYRKLTGSTRKTCCVIGCSGEFEVGGHVKTKGTDLKQYIIPICRSCNAKLGQFLKIYPNTKMASANKGKTCEKYI